MKVSNWRKKFTHTHTNIHENSIKSLTEIVNRPKLIRFRSKFCAPKFFPTPSLKTSVFVVVVRLFSSDAYLHDNCPWNLQQNCNKSLLNSQQIIHAANECLLFDRLRFGICFTANCVSYFFFRFGFPLVLCCPKVFDFHKQRRIGLQLFLNCSEAMANLAKTQLALGSEALWKE